MTDEEYDYTEPWPLYQGEDEPWKDYGRLLRLDEEMDTQYEMGDALGCTPATISYHLQKARDEHEPDHSDEELQCEFFETCGNLTIGPDNDACSVCIDLARYNERVDGPEPDDSTTLSEHIERLHKLHSDKVAEWQGMRPDYHADDGNDSTAEA